MRNKLSETSKKEMENLQQQSEGGKDEYMTTSISLTKNDYELLRDIAIKRAKNQETRRINVSAIIQELIQESRPRLEKEANS